MLASSAIPPVLPSGRYRSRPVLDGGLVDNAPVLLAANEPGRTLVLLTRRYERPLPVVSARTYAQPSRPIPIGKFDYANPLGLQLAYDLGREDGAGFAEAGGTSDAGG